VKFSILKFEVLSFNNN